MRWVFHWEGGRGGRALHQVGWEGGREEGAPSGGCFIGRERGREGAPSGGCSTGGREGGREEGAPSGGCFIGRERGREGAPSGGCSTGGREGGREGNYSKPVAYYIAEMVYWVSYT